MVFCFAVNVVWKLSMHLVSLLFFSAILLFMVSGMLSGCFNNTHSFESKYFSQSVFRSRSSLLPCDLKNSTMVLLEFREVMFMEDSESDEDDISSWFEKPELVISTWLVISCLLKDSCIWCLIEELFSLQYNRMCRFEGFWSYSRN